MLLKEWNDLRILPSSLENKAVLRKYDRESYIYQDNETADRIFFLNEGFVKVIKFSSSGKKMIMEYKQAGDWIGLETLFQADDEFYDNSLMTLTNVKVAAFQRKDLEAFIINSPELAIDIFKQMGTRYREMSARLMDYTLNDIFSKTIKTIQMLGNDYGQIIRENKLMIDLPITNRELSDIIGTTRETIGRVMSKLKEADIISVTKKRIIINDWNKFCLLAEKY